MRMSRADERHDITIDEYIASLSDETTKNDSHTLYEIMRRISGEEPILYGIGTIGFGVFKYEYQSGRKGESHTLGFYPRNNKITIYLTDGTKRYNDFLLLLGKHSTTGYCLYIRRLSDIELPVLVTILEKSYENITMKSQHGPLRQIPWQDER